MKLTVEPLAAKSILNPVRAPSMPFAWSINPYRGCQHGCSFCYARGTHAFLDKPADDTFQRHIFWKAGAPDLLRRELARLAQAGKRPEHVAIGTATDPYQPLEAKTRLTRGCLEALAEFGVPFSITTRSPLVLRDLDILRAAPVQSVNISLHTLDASIWRQFEPATPAPAARLAAIAELADAGVPVQVFMAPVLPYLTDTAETAAAVGEACKARGANGVMVQFLRLSTPEVKVWFFATLQRHYPNLAPLYGRLYHRSAHPPETYRRRARARMEAELRRCGLLRPDAGKPPGSGRPAADAIAVGSTGERPPEAVCSPVQLTLF